jgi:hypothetical protein
MAEKLEIAVAMCRAGRWAVFELVAVSEHWPLREIEDYRGNRR